jgi:hypothetical protein
MHLLAEFMLIRNKMIHGTYDLAAFQLIFAVRQDKRIIKWRSEKLPSATIWKIRPSNRCWASFTGGDFLFRPQLRLVVVF